MSFKSTLILFSLLLSSLLLVSCMSMPGSIENRIKTAEQISLKNNYVKTVLNTKNMPLVGYIKNPSNSQPLAQSTYRIYIEGDGLAWISRHQPSRNPTPKNPLALKLAVQDKSLPVIYLARPCQYLSDKHQYYEKACQLDYWTAGRYRSEIIETYHLALDQLKKQNNITQFELVGYSGGAQIAALLAATRKDIVRLITVAGNIDHQTWTELKKISPLTGSLNASDYAHLLKNIPQIHFIGAEDKIVPIEVAQSYEQAINSPTAKFLVIPKQGHHGWEKQWPALLEKIKQE